MQMSKYRSHRRLVGASIGGIVSIAVLLALLVRAQTVEAAGVVTNCTESGLDAALAGGGAVTFACGPNPVTINIAGGQKIISQSTSIDGGGKITLNANGTSNIFQVNAGSTLSLSGISLINGNAGSADGGCIYVNGGSLFMTGTVLQGCTVNNSNNLGGGIFDVNGAVTIISSTLTGNSASQGGAIYISGTLATLNVSHSNISTNTASYGGGIVNQGTATLTDLVMFYDQATTCCAGAIANGGSMTLISSTLKSNFVSNGSGGGGISNGGALTMTNDLLSGNWAFYGAAIQNLGSLILERSTLSGNTTTNQVGGRGGALYNLGIHAFLTATQSVISGNRATYGGALYNLYGRATFSATTFSGNFLDWSNAAGGAIDNYVGTVSLNYSTLSGNTGGNGGAIENGDNLTIDNSTLIGNVGQQQAGGIENLGQLTVRGTTFYSNTAGGGGGGIYSHTDYDHPNAAAFLTNSTLSGNSANTGGGIGSAAYVSLTNVTLAYNSATTSGGNLSQYYGSIDLQNSIIAYGTGGNCQGNPFQARYSISSDSTCTLAGTGNLTTTDPLLYPLGNYGGPTQVHMLKPGSPAIDGVLNNSGPTVDQRGVTRPQGTNLDIGAVERRSTDITPRIYLPLIDR